MVVSSNEDVAYVSLLCLNDNNIEDYEKQDIVTNIEFETIISSIKKDLFNQRMVGFVNKIDLSDKKYQSNGIVRDDIYKGKLLFPMKYFV